MKINKPFIIKLSNSQEMKIYWNEWYQKWKGYIWHHDNLDKLIESFESLFSFDKGKVACKTKNLQ